MTSQPVAEDATPNAPAPLCERCDQPFTGRKGTGGKPQRFCSPECRTAFHSDSGQRDQRSPTCNEVAVPPATPIADPTATTQQAPQRDYEEDVNDVDCQDDEDVIIRRQPETHVYWNAHNQIVIRQENWPDDDHFVVFSLDTIPRLIARLKEMADYT
jgi:hypothetical protein